MARRGPANTRQAGPGMAWRGSANTRQARRVQARQGEANTRQAKRGLSATHDKQNSVIKRNEDIMSSKTQDITIAAPKIETVCFNIVGTAPYVQHKFSQKARQEILQKQLNPSKSKSKKNHDPRDIEGDYKAAMHLTPDGRHGIPAPAFRSAMISACRVAGFQMTKAKLSVFVEHDDLDAEEGTPLVYIKGEPEMHEAAVRIESGGTTVAFRPMWRKWSAELRVKFDRDQFTPTDVANLIMRAGLQVGIGEGRPDSRKSTGMRWGTLEYSTAGTDRQGEARQSKANTRQACRGSAWRGLANTWQAGQCSAWHSLARQTQGRHKISINLYRQKS